MAATTPNADDADADSEDEHDEHDEGDDHDSADVDCSDIVGRVGGTPKNSRFQPQ